MKEEGDMSDKTMAEKLRKILALYNAWEMSPEEIELTIQEILKVRVKLPKEDTRYDDFSLGFNKCRAEVMRLNGIHEKISGVTS